MFHIAAIEEALNNSKDNAGQCRKCIWQIKLTTLLFSLETFDKICQVNFLDYRFVIVV